VNIFVSFLSLTTPLVGGAQHNSIKNALSQKNRIHEQKFILINGIEQWVTIKGERTKPVLL